MKRVSSVNTGQQLPGSIDDQPKTREELIAELEQFRHIVARLGTLGIGHKLDKATIKYLSLPKAIIEQSSEGLAVTDMEGNLLALNNSFAKMHGYSPEELIGKHLSIFHTPEQMPSVEAANQQVHDTGEFDGEIWHARRDGTVFPTLMHNSILRDEDGNQISMISTLCDITEHKRAEKEFQDSEEKYQQFIENFSDPIWVFDRDGVALMTNTPATAALGGKPEDYIGRSLFDYMPNEAGLLQERHRQIMDSGIAATFEDMIELPKGKIWARSNIQPVKDAEGNITGVQIISYDITKHKQTEEAIQSNENNYRILFNSTIDGLLVLDAKTIQVVLANDAAAKIGQYKCGEELVGINLLELIHPEDRENVIKIIMEDMFENDLQEINEFRGILRNGTEIRVEAVGTRIEYSGKLAGLISLRDITERKRAEESLIKRNKELTALNAIAQTVSQSISLDEILDNSLDKTLEILNVKNGSIALFDEKSCSFAIKSSRGVDNLNIDILTPVKLEEIGGAKISQLRKPKFIDSIQDFIELIPRNFVNLVNQQQLKSAMYVPLMAKGKVLGEICVFTIGNRIFTIEERELLITISHQISAGIENAQLLEEASRATALEELDKLRTELLASVSHELRTPLTSIKGLASTLIQSDIEWDKETQIDFLQTINRETDVLAHIVSDLMDMSQLEAGIIRMQKTRSTIASIIGQISEQLKNSVVNHKLKLNLPANIPSIYVDEVRIGEVIINLVSNAAAYSETGTRITLEASHLDGTVVTTISDEGIGIPAKHLDKIFDRFFRLESGVFRRRGGTGLGLSICKGIVENHGGLIWAESIPDKGSKFSFSLPITYDSESIIAEAATDT